MAKPREPRGYLAHAHFSQCLNDPQPFNGPFPMKSERGHHESTWGGLLPQVLVLRVPHPRRGGLCLALGSHGAGSHARVQSIASSTRPSSARMRIAGRWQSRVKLPFSQRSW